MSESGQSRREPRGVKKASIPRPDVEEGITESDLSFFLARWRMYEEATRIEGKSAIQQLWAACSLSLQKTLHNQGVVDVVDPKVLLERIRNLAVHKPNNLVNVIRFQQMCQDRDEGVHAFLARLNGQAELCDMTVKCPSETCSRGMSFKERLTMLQLVRVLHDAEIQGKVLQEGATEEEEAVRSGG